jgi:hypothetical protein
MMPRQTPGSATTQKTPVPPGTWARKVAPHGTFTLYDAAERLGVSVCQVRRLIRAYEVPVGMVARIVRLGPGTLRKRRFLVLTPSALQALLLKYTGLEDGRASVRALLRARKARGATRVS